MMNIITSLFKRFAVYLVFFFAGVVGGIYVHEYLGKPKLIYETTIEKQKVKGNARGDFQNEIKIQHNEQEQKQKTNFFKRIFGRKGHAGDSTDTVDAD